ncbi:MAG: YfhO family protein [Thermoflavifilum sp.]|nr:YfhO family protein [Thermoflavifilum sp.]
MHKLYQQLKPYLGITVLALLIYWPLSIAWLSLKNDAAVAYLPVRYQMSQAIHQGIIPFWSPYLNYGFPLHADFTSGFWNPLIWLLISLFHYNIYTLHLEWMIYAILAGWGMYAWCTTLQFSPQIAFLLSVAYMSSGFFIGSASWMNWLAPIAWLPFVLNYMLKLFQHPHIRNALWLSIFLWLYISYAHPDFLIGLGYWMGLSCLLGVVLFYQEWKARCCWNLVKQIGYTLLALLALSAGMIISIATAIPYMYRSNPLQLSQLDHPFNIACWISFLFPLSTTQPLHAWDHTDILLRSGYVGMLLFIAAWGSITKMWKDKRIQFWLIHGIFFLLLSSGWLQHAISLPFVRYVRLESFWRIGTIFSMLMCAGYFLQSLVYNASNKKTFIRLIWILFSIYFIFFILLEDSSLKIFTDILSSLRSPQINTLKDLLYSLNMLDKIWIQAAIGTILTGWLLWIIKKRHTDILKWVCVISIIDLAISAQMMLPFLVVGKTKLSYIQHILQDMPQSYSIPPLIPIQQYDTFPTQWRKLIGSKSFYDHQIGSPQNPSEYPNLLTSLREFYKSNYVTCSNKTPFVYFSTSVYPIQYLNQACHTLDSNSIFLFTFHKTQLYYTNPHQGQSSLQVISIIPGRISIHVNNQETGMLLLKQNYYPFWKAYDGKKSVSIYPANISFMAIPLLPGLHHINFVYQPGIIQICFWIMWISFIIIILVLSYISIKPFISSNTSSHNHS